jgi:hypothetical protein
MSRSTFTLGDNSYPLAHLSGFRVTVPAKDPLAVPAVLQVTCSCHVYSEKWDAARHQIANRFEDDGEARSFCPVRYGCSINLEALIRYHIAGKAYWGRDGKGVLNSFFYGDADGIAYPIYFRLGAADRINGVHGLMHIISAYQNADLPARHRFDAIKFARLVYQKCPPKN